MKGSSKTTIFSLVCYFILSIVFWIVLFLVSPDYVEFAVTNEEIERMQIPDNRNVYSYDFDINTWQETYDRIRQTEKTQGIVGTILLIYALMGYILMFSVVEKEAMHKSYLPLLFCLFVAIFIISNVYYNYIFAPFSKNTKDYMKYFILLKTLPTSVISYTIIRKIFMLFTTKEPKLVGKFDWMTDPGNWLFTMMVFLGGFGAAYFIPWF